MGVMRPADDLPERELLDSLRDALVETPRPDAEARHLAMILAARGEAPTRELATRRRVGALRLGPFGVPSALRFRFGLAAANVLVIALALGATTAGLATAGVRLPDAARAPFEVVGIDLPHQRADDGATAQPKRKTADADRSVGSTARPGTRQRSTDGIRSQPGTERARERSREGVDRARERTSTVPAPVRPPVGPPAPSRQPGPPPGIPAPPGSNPGAGVRHQPSDPIPPFAEPPESGAGGRSQEVQTRTGGPR